MFALILAASGLLLLFVVLRFVASIQHTHVLNWSNGSVTLSSSVVLTGQEEINVGIAIAPSSTNQQIANFAFTLAKLQGVYILSDQNLTLKTNSTGSPQDTITITANEPFEWNNTSGIAAPFAGSVTALYVTTGAILASANLNIKTLVVSP
jgi:hypothetical protein